MANEATAGAPPQGVSEETYEALLSALSSSSIGRGFLAEYARRNRAADTETLLSAMARLEAAIAARNAEPAEPPTAEVLVKPELDQPLESATEDPPPVDAEMPVVAWEMSPAEAAVAAASAEDAAVEALAALEQELLAVPEAPPTPTEVGIDDTPPGEATDDVVEETAFEAVAAIAEDETADRPPAAASTEPTEDPFIPAQAEIQDLDEKAGEIAPRSALEPGLRPDEAEETLPPRDPLEQIMALSEEERIALFS